MNTSGPISSTPTRASHSEAKVDKTLSNKSLSQEVATETLKKNGAEGSADFQFKSSVVPQQVGLWGAIQNFFNRRFSEITLDEKKQDEEITVLIGKTERAIEQVSKSARDATNEERQLAGKFPSMETLAVSEKYLNELREKLATAKEVLKELKKHESTAIELANKHSTYEALTGQIQKLDKEIVALEARVKITEKLFNIEASMKDYRFQGTWERFIKVRDERKALVEAMKDIRNNSNLKAEGAQKILDKESLNGADIHQYIKSTFLGLKGYIERLWDGTLIIFERRAQALGQQTEVLNALFSLYNKESNQIRALEKSIFGNSPIDIVYRLFKGEDNLIQELEKIREGQIETYKEIKKAAKFNSEELNWLTEMDSKQELSIEIARIRQEVSYLDLREEVTDQISILQQELKLYCDDLTLRAQKEKINQAKRTKGAEDFALTQELKDSIRSTIQKLAIEAKRGRFKQESLPKNFNEMDAVDQLKNVISLSFPTLQYRNEDIFKLIKKSKLHEELDLALKVEEQVKPSDYIDLSKFSPPDTQEPYSVKIAILRDYSLPHEASGPPPADAPPELPALYRTKNKDTTTQSTSQQTLSTHSTESPIKEQYKKIDIEAKPAENQEEKTLSLAEQLQRRKEQGLRKVNIEEIEQKIAPKISKEALEKAAEEAKVTAEETKPSVKENRNALFGQINKGEFKLKKDDATTAEPKPKTAEVEEGGGSLLADIRKGKQLRKTGVVIDASTETAQPKVETPYKQLIKRINEGEKLEKILADKEMQKAWNDIPEPERLALTLQSTLQGRRLGGIADPDETQENNSEWD